MLFRSNLCSYSQVLSRCIFNNIYGTSLAGRVTTQQKHYFTNHVSTNRLPPQSVLQPSSGQHVNASEQHLLSRTTIRRFHDDEQKTYATMINKEEGSYLMVDAYSQVRIIRLFLDLVKFAHLQQGNFRIETLSSTKPCSVPFFLSAFISRYSTCLAPPKKISALMLMESTLAVFKLCDCDEFLFLISNLAILLRDVSCVGYASYAWNLSFLCSLFYKCFLIHLFLVYA